MAKGKVDFSFWNRLIYFRWKALIRSKQYNDFYKRKVKVYLNDKIANLQYSAKNNYSIDSYLDDFIQGKVAFKEDSNGYFDGETRERELLKYAEKHFGLIVPFVEALKPIDINNFPLSNDRWITFREYIHIMPKGHQYRTLLESLFIQEIKNIKDTDSITIHGITQETHLIIIDISNQPIELICDAVKKKLSYSEKRVDRKDFDKWEEAFKAWDIQKITNNLYKTAQLMGWENRENRKGDGYIKEALRDIVSKKCNVAEELISLAGQGKFKTP